MAAGTAKWATWLPMVAAGAVAAYAITKRQGRRPTQHGTGVIADRDSDTRRRLGGYAGIHVEESVTSTGRHCRGVSLLAQLREPAEVHAAPRVGLDARRRDFALGGTRPGRHERRMGRAHHQRDRRTRSSAGSRSTVRRSRPPARSTFDETAHGTRVRVHLQYSPPGGKLGAAVAWLFGEEPTIQIREDLRRFKQLIETGEIPTTEGQPSGRASGATMKAVCWEGTERRPRRTRPRPRDPQPARRDRPRHVDRDLRIGPAPDRRIHSDDEGGRHPRPRVHGRGRRDRPRRHATCRRATASSCRSRSPAGSCFFCTHELWAVLRQLEPERVRSPKSSTASRPRACSAIRT